jgi:hypothetical protein
MTNQVAKNRNISNFISKLLASTLYKGGHGLMAELMTPAIAAKNFPARCRACKSSSQLFTSTAFATPQKHSDLSSIYDTICPQFTTTKE